MAKLTCPDCDEKIDKELDSQCEVCDDWVCEGCQEDHAIDEAFP